MSIYITKITEITECFLVFYYLLDSFIMIFVALFG